MSDSPLELLQRRFTRSATFEVDADFVSSISGGGTLSAAEAVEVYRRGYRARLTEALGETFEACWRVLGDDGFFAAARAYIALTPSTSHNLSDYGATFPAFLEGRAFKSFKFDAPFLGDLARYEWEFKELFHEAPHRGLSPAELAARARPDSRLRFGSAHRLLALRHRVYGIWTRDRADDTPLAPSDWAGEERLLLYKKEGNPIFVRELSAPEHRALTAVAAGRPLDEALAGATGLDAAAAQRLFAFLAEARLVTEVE